MRVVAPWILTVLLFPALSFAQGGQRGQSLQLGCVHVYPVQMKYLEKHVNFMKLTPDLERRTVEQFVKRYDGSKLYFLDKDVKDIEKWMAGTFDKVRNKDCTAMDKVNQLFIQRVEERVAYARKYLGPKFKIDPKAQVQRDPEDHQRSKTLADANKYHEAYMQYQVASLITPEMKLDEAKTSILKNYERALKRVKEFKYEDLLSSYLDSFARALDPHSSYMSADALEDFEIQMRLSLEGIGATLTTKDDFTVIEQLIPGGAAAVSKKLKAKDKIVAVGQGKDGAFADVVGMDLREVVKLIRGPKGSEVRLQILRKSSKESQRFEVTLIRDKIKLDDEAASITYMDREVGGQKLKIGLLNLPSFYADSRKNGPTAAGDMKKLLAEAAKKKTDAIVLDLSSNGGGSLRDAVDIAGLFFQTGNVVRQSQRVTSELDQMNYETLRDTDSTVDWAGPLVVLTSRVSASASEIVSGTLQDYHRAVIVGGDHTFGKGTVQSVEYLPPGLGAIKTTVGMFFTAGGESTQHRGVSGDLVFPSTLATDEVGEKTLDYSLPPKKIKEFLSPTAYVTEGKGAWAPVTKDLVKKLKDQSDPRVVASLEFKKVRDDIDKFKKRGKTIVVADLIKDRETKDKEKKKDAKNKQLKKGDADGGSDSAAGDVDDPDGDDDVNLSREERKKKYLERADIIESVNVAADLALALKTPTIQVGSKSTHPSQAPDHATTSDN